MISTFDVAILGTGTMGSAAAYFLSKSGLKVVAFERFRMVHEMGSHSGSTRIIRHAYHESPDYVPLVLRSDELWRELEKITARQLLIRTGGIDLGPVEGTVVDQALLACRTHSLPYEHLNATEVLRRWPQFNIPDNWHACFDPNMGFLMVDDCIAAYANAAKSLGARIHENEQVLSFDCASAIRIHTDKGDYEAGKMVVCAGAWNQKLLRDLHLPLTIKRKALVWLQTQNPENFEVGKFPIFLTDTPVGLLYGFPIHKHPGLKIANHHDAGPAVDPDYVDREFHSGDAKDARDFALRHLRGVTSNVLEGKICLYTLTPDEDFLIDLHPENKNVAIAAGFSGHGFKFAPVVAEILSDLVQKGTTDHPVQKFQLSRFFN
ncbi:N-methyl-L-tryptophan oxidase [bacterium]|nr:N-methyl-L-tryptophan oxidase [bacterium]